MRGRVYLSFQSDLRLRDGFIARMYALSRTPLLFLLESLCSPMLYAKSNELSYAYSTTVKLPFTNLALSLFSGITEQNGILEDF